MRHNVQRTRRTRSRCGTVVQHIFDRIACEDLHTLQNLGLGYNIVHRSTFYTTFYITAGCTLVKARSCDRMSSVCLSVMNDENL